MKGLWLGTALGLIALVGCKSTPKREMRPPTTIEFTEPPERLNNPPDYPRDTPALTPKSTGPGMMPGPGIGSPSGPGTTPGMQR